MTLVEVLLGVVVVLLALWCLRLHRVLDELRDEVRKVHAIARLGIAGRRAPRPRS